MARKPMAVFCMPVVLLNNAFDPTATLLETVLLNRVLSPTATLLLAAPFSLAALIPTATLLRPEEFETSA